MTGKVDYTVASSSQVMRDLGRRLEAIRLARNITQSQLAALSGSSESTIARLEKGRSGSMESLVRVMLALRLVSHLETLLPDPGIRPIERAKSKGRERQRARPPKNARCRPAVGMG